MNEFITRTNKGKVLEAWLNGDRAQNHNGTLRTLNDGVLEYADIDIALRLPELELSGSLDDLDTRDYDFVVVNPEESSSRTMNKHIFQIIKLLRKKRILIVPIEDFNVLRNELISV